jgi:hypothetical protein
MNRKQGPRVAGMRPAVHAGSHRQLKVGEPLNVKEVAI